MTENIGTKKRFFALCSLVLPLLLAATVRAQGQTEETTSEKPEEEATVNLESSEQTAVQNEALTQPATDSNAGIAEMEAKIVKQEAEIGQLKQEMQTLAQRFDQSEEAELDMLTERTEQVERIFSIHGFFDLNLSIRDVPDDASGKNVFPEDLSFVVNRLNLYFSSQMSETLSALVEVRFTFLPIGSEESFEEPLFFQTDYRRTKTRHVDPFTTENVDLGGLLIERVHLTWKPFDAFGITVGRFLTPYGIWNVDHGSPVLIPILPPYFMIREMIPSAQTGVQFFGRFFPYKSTYFDYALTVSNNRGPTEEIYDLSNQKAVGLRLKGSYESEDFSASLGGYLYYGTVQDILKRIVDYTTWPRTVVEDVYKYEELTGSLDLLIELFHTRLQVEFVRGMVVYSDRHVRTIPILEMPLQVGGDQPDYLRTAVFFLLGYEIQFKAGESYMSLMPYANFEYTEPDDTYPSITEYMIRGGLNYKPSPFVTLKAEVMHGEVPEPDTSLDRGRYYETYSTQMAVSF